MWESVTFLLRLGLYFALSGLVAASVSLLLSDTLNYRLNKPFSLSLKRYFKFSLLAYILISLGYFWIRVGAFAEEGLQGLFDPLMISILYDSGLGDALNISLIASLLAALFYGASQYLKPVWVRFALCLAMLLSISLSFSFTGHMADFSLIEKSLLSLHILIAFLWLGSLYPLLRWLQLENIILSQKLFERFGFYASFLVPLLLIAGLGLSYLITGFDLALLMTPWGGVLLFKLMVVVAILALAAWHKYRLVPQLLATNGKNKMGRSLVWEIVLGVGILAFSAVLSTSLSP